MKKSFASSAKKLGRRLITFDATVMRSEIGSKDKLQTKFMGIRRYVLWVSLFRNGIGSAASILPYYIILPRIQHLG